MTLCVTSFRSPIRDLATREAILGHIMLSNKCTLTPAFLVSYCASFFFSPSDIICIPFFFCFLAFLLHVYHHKIMSPRTAGA